MYSECVGVFRWSLRSKSVQFVECSGTKASAQNARQFCRLLCIFCVCVIFVSHSFVFAINTVVCFVLIRSKSVHFVDCSGAKTLAQNALQFCKKQQFLLVCVCHQ